MQTVQKQDNSQSLKDLGSAVHSKDTKKSEMYSYIIILTYLCVFQKCCRITSLNSSQIRLEPNLLLQAENRT